ncbi:hypothetical protein GF391_03235 [Candidatus Uhrbacteria bacterium]|nr:hypothetical protein [Candidatus Uhrbacteria bacterium]
MHRNLFHLGKAWFKKHGPIKVMITPRGGIELLHEDFRGMLSIPKDRVKPERDQRGRVIDGQYRAHFEDFLKTAYLREDFKSCTVFYKDRDGTVLGSADLTRWTCQEGKPRNVLAITPGPYDENRSIRVCLPPVNSHTVPEGTCTAVFRFEFTHQNMRLSKYLIECPVVKDLRYPPRVGNRDRGGNRHYKRAASM